jgi:acetylornithine deacetylase
MERSIELLADLVSIPSVNPMGRAGEGREYGEEQIAGLIAAYLRMHKVDVEISEVAKGRPCVVGHVDSGAEETLLLEAHLDTVGGERMAIEPFTAAIEDGKLYGRGSCDAKGSLAAFFAAVCSLLGGKRKLKRNVLLLAVPDEEYRFTGALHAVSRGLRADWGIAGEPTCLNIVRAHKGVTRWKIVARGVAAHSAYPERGRNAIFAMGQALVRIELYAGLLREGQGHPLLGVPTLGVGVIEGGQAVNIVPDRCWVEVDRRTLPGETAGTVTEPVKRLLDDLPDLELETPYLSVPGMEVEADSPFLKTLSEAILGVTGRATFEVARYATDAGIYGAAGIPTVVFGPGDIAQAHTEREFIDLDQYQAAIKIIQRLLV